MSILPTSTDYSMEYAGLYEDIKPYKEIIEARLIEATQTKSSAAFVSLLKKMLVQKNATFIKAFWMIPVAMDKGITDQMDDILTSSPFQDLWANLKGFQENLETHRAEYTKFWEKNGKPQPKTNHFTNENAVPTPPTQPKKLESIAEDTSFIATQMNPISRTARFARKAFQPVAVVRKPLQPNSLVLNQKQNG
jgi:hypothetical protein